MSDLLIVNRTIWADNISRASMPAWLRVENQIWVDLILLVLDEQDRQHNITQRRNSIIGEEHRFFLALLLNVAGREKVLEPVKQRFPETDPVQKILDWVEELGQTRVLGSHEANALGIEGFDDNYLVTLEGLLQGLSDEEKREQHQ